MIELLRYVCVEVTFPSPDHGYAMWQEARAAFRARNTLQGMNEVVLAGLVGGWTRSSFTE